MDINIFLLISEQQVVALIKQRRVELIANYKIMHMADISGKKRQLIKIIIAQINHQRGRVYALIEANFVERVNFAV
jgi:hypothetical protein